MPLAHNTTEFPNQPPQGQDGLCTLDTCPLSRAIFKFHPILGYAAPPLALFAFLTFAHVGLGIRYRTWPFMVAMVMGTLLETIGYLGRVMGHVNPFIDTWYMMQIAVLTFAPVFFCAAIYMSLSWIIVVYGRNMARMQPVWYTRVFITCDVISLLLQSAGGGIAASAEDEKGNDLGINIMLAGLVFQVVTLFVFSGLGLEYAYRVRKNPNSVDMTTESLRATKRWKGFLCAMIFSTGLLVIRSIYRVIEMSEGYNGALIKNQELFLIFEGILVVFACGALAVFHPGFSYAHMKGLKSRIRDSAHTGTELMEPGKVATGELSSTSS